MCVFACVCLARSREAEAHMPPSFIKHKSGGINRKQVQVLVERETAEHRNPRPELVTSPRTPLCKPPCGDSLILDRWRQDQKCVHQRMCSWLTNLFSSSTDSKDGHPVTKTPSFSLTQCSALLSGEIAKIKSHYTPVTLVKLNKKIEAL